MLSREMASIIKYTLDKTDGVTAYYKEVPAGFQLPAVYFP